MSQAKIRIYIAGPMSGHPNLNWNAFDEKEKQLTAAGFDVVNPARMDREIGLDPENVGEYDYEEAAGRDIEALGTCDAIYLMAGFQHSKGACWERALAKQIGTHGGGVLTKRERSRLPALDHMSVYDSVSPMRQRAPPNDFGSSDEEVADEDGEEQW